MAMTEQKNPRELHIGFIGVGVMGRQTYLNSASRCCQR